MRWLLTALKQIWIAVFGGRRRTIEISNKLFDEITPIMNKRRGARRKKLNNLKRKFPL